MPIPIFTDLAAAQATILRRVPFDEVEVTPALLDGIEARVGERLTPSQVVERIVTEPLRAQREDTPADTRARAAEVLDSVGLRITDLDKYPHEFSGGQRQRIAIARALITRPRLIVADEPVSALDVSVQAQVLNLMQDLQAQYGVTYLLISHDLAVVHHLCEEVAVLWQGRIVEQGPPDRLFRDPQHPYTRTLLDAVLGA